MSFRGQRFKFLLLMSAFCSYAGHASAQGILYQWNFNDSTTTPNQQLTGSAPAITLLGGATSAFVAAATTNGMSSSDPVPAASNNAFNTTTYPTQGTASGTAGVQFTMPTNGTGVGLTDLVFRFDQRNSGTASYFNELQYTLDGTNWVSFAVYRAGGIDTFLTQTFDFSSITGANNNGSFAVRSLAVFDPALVNSYSATNGNGTYAGTGTIRYDLATLSRGTRWVGGTDSNNLANTANFTIAPTTADTLLFGSSVNTTLNVATNVTYNQLLFQTNAPNHTINASAGQSLTLLTGIVNNSTSTLTFNTPLDFGGMTTLQNNGVLLFNGNVTMGAVVPTTTRFGMQIGGSGTVVMNGTYIGNDITLSSGRTIAGIGTIHNEVHNYGGTVRGGFSDGTNDFGTLTINFFAPNGPGSGDLELYLAPGNRAPTIQVAATRTGVNTVNNSRIALLGGVDVDLEINNAVVGGPARFDIQLLANNLILGENYRMTILTTDSTGSIEYGNAPQPDQAFIDPASFSLVSSNYSFTGVSLQVVDVAAGSTLVLSFTPVPEPVSCLCISVAAGVWIRTQRRKRTCGTIS